ncbi:MAG TPA: ornithine carbamoyltransferase [Patescibacteria group bacterium]|nr:ornithine carbamoyltransferase [Patescibacteria group bacterium]
MKLSKKDFLSIRDFSREELDTIVALSREQKPLARQFRLKSTHAGRVLACIFHKPSLRTRVSFEVAMRQLGGSSLYITEREIGIGSREAPKDVGAVMSRFVDGIMIRTFDQGLVEEIASYAAVPVVNGLTDLLHPCQVMGDILTVIERFGTIEGKKVVMIGDGNNLARSWLNAAARYPFTFILSSPPAYAISDDYIEEVRRDGDPDYRWAEDPMEAVKGAHVVYADVWASMGQESERERRIKAFRNYQINDTLMSRADKESVFLHCLPAHRGEEVTDSVIDGPHSLVYEEAENRLHIQRAILALLIPGEE